MKKGHNQDNYLPHPVIPGDKHLIALYYFAWDLAKQHISHMDGLVAEDYMDEGFEADKIWQWDTSFMAMFCKYAPDLFPGIESLDNFYAVQKEDGYIAMSHFLETGEDSYPLPCGRINPPLLSWVEWEYYLVSGNSDRLNNVLPHLLKYDEWIEKYRKRDDGSYWFADCGCSGMDNSPRTSRTDHQGAETSFVDLASQQALSALNIARIANVVNETAIEKKYHHLYLQRAEYINKKLWNKRHAFYYDRHTDGNFVNCKTVASFWPMLAEITSAEQVNSLVEHLQDANEFNRPHLVPTLSYDDANYHCDGGYWLGGVWAPTNYMIVRGLMKNNQHQLARTIARNHLEALYRAWKNYKPHTLWECYSPENDAPAMNEDHKLCRQDFVGWTGLGPIAMLIETILGIEVDYPNRKIIWHSDILDEHGIDNLRFGPHMISLRCKKRKDLNQKPTLEIKSPCDVSVEIK